MTISVVSRDTLPRKVKGSPGKQVLHDSNESHVWIHGPNDPGDKGPMHNHTADEIFVCISGEATFNFPNRPSEVLQPGMMIIIPKGDYYQVTASGKGEMNLFGMRSEPSVNPRFSVDGDNVEDGSNRFKAGATY
jgi:mannose-6-phosphate isomerase-like protein (cupin superfamily)